MYTRGMSELSARDAIVIGSGAGGATIAGALARAGAAVTLVEAGPALGAIAGANARNLFPGERALDEQAALMRGLRPDPARGDEPLAGLPNTALVRGVGGMLTQWLGNCPEPEPELERPECIPLSDWLTLVERARDALGVRTDLAEGGVRQARLIERLRSAVATPSGERDVQPMPVSGTRAAVGVMYHGADVLLGVRPELQIRADTVATRLIANGPRITEVEIVWRDRRQPERIAADAVVVAAGTVGTPQLLVGSEVDAGPALGHYLTDHPNVESTVRLHPDIVEGAGADDPMFMIWIPFTRSRRRHSMVHRSYPWEAPSYQIPFDEARRSAELRTLCGMAPVPENRLTFHTESLDAFGLPRVSGQIALSPADREHLRASETAHAELARAIEDPRHPTRARVKDHLPRGAPHLCGSHRMGDRPDGTSVTDSFGRVWAYENLYLAGNGMLPGSSSCNPALTVVAVALRTAAAILAAYD